MRLPAFFAPLSLLMMIFGANSEAAAQAPADAALRPLPVAESQADVLGEKVNVASKVPTTIKLAPAIVSVVTQAEIEASGARDLIDILALVPGFFSGLDTQGVVDFGIRGLWAHEGKMLLQIDGREANEALYGTSQFGNHFPAQLVKRVEIIRGPGSAVYGGYAELGVVNIVTKTAKDLNGAYAGVLYGQTERTYGQQDIALGYGKTFGDWSGSVTGFFGRGQRSDRDYTDTSGATTNLAYNQDLNPAMINAQLDYRRLELKYIYDHYHTSTLDGYGTNFPGPLDNNFYSQMLHVKYNGELADGLTLTPELRYRQMTAWQCNMPGVLPSNSYFYDRSDVRAKAKLGSIWSPSESFSLSMGLESIQDSAHDNSPLPSDVFYNNTKDAQFTTNAAFAEGNYDFGLARLIVGGRVDANSQTGTNYSPRIGFIKAWDQWNGKLLYNEAFRAPAIENIDANSAIVPETTQVTEFEVGYQPAPSTAFRFNAYDIHIKNVIVYSSTASGASIYQNFDASGTQGFEFEARQKGDWGAGALSYSFYRVNSNDVAAYAVPGRDDVMLAFPAHKIALSGYALLGSPDLKLAPSAIFMSERWAYDTSANQPDRFNPAVLINLNLRKENFLVPGLSASIGVFNIGDEDVRFSQAYFSSASAYHRPLPALSRDYVAQLSYSRQL